MNELARAIVLLCQLLEDRGLFDINDDRLTELRALYMTLLRRSESARDYHQRARGKDAIAVMLDADSMFPLNEPPPLPQKMETR